MKILMKHDSGVTKEVKCGFSWTTFFFGFIVPLIRGDLKWALIMVAISIAVGIPTLGIGGFISGIIFSFVYNKIYIKELLVKGYKPANETAKNILAEQSIISA
ncbi:DUF2628 domain-containing protein [Clostridium sp. FAM 1755]|uniref:hypothetical protein n=1 Tax=Clostridium TaxID=1485 RepID=UPI0006ABC08D|nr:MULTISPECIES: hypothetical protein [Clostridium]KOR27056.1 hypothetical protein ND00_00250 [Clostridium sp. L74]NFV12846.1 DUF2628 domain-containing protein [Clostridium sporogenes]